MPTGIFRKQAVADDSISIIKKWFFVFFYEVSVFIFSFQHKLIAACMLLILIALLSRPVSLFFLLIITFPSTFPISTTPQQFSFTASLISLHYYILHLKVIQLHKSALLLQVRQTKSEAWILGMLGMLFAVITSEIGLLTICIDF